MIYRYIDIYDSYGIEYSDKPRLGCTWQPKGAPVVEPFTCGRRRCRQIWNPFSIHVSKHASSKTVQREQVKLQQWSIQGKHLWCPCSCMECQTCNCPLQGRALGFASCSADNLDSRQAGTIGAPTCSAVSSGSQVWHFTTTFALWSLQHICFT